MVLEFHSTTKCGAKPSILIIEKSIIRKKRIFVSTIEHERNRQSTNCFGFIESSFLSVDVNEKVSYKQSGNEIILDGIKMKAGEPDVIIKISLK